MKNILILLFCLIALLAQAANSITNYATVTNFDSTEFFLLSKPSTRTNYNLQANYVASTADLNAASNSILAQMPETNGFIDVSLLNTASNAVLGKVLNASNSILAQVPTNMNLYNATSSVAHTFASSVLVPYLILGHQTSAPPPSLIGSNNGALWSSNTYLYWSATTNGTSSNSAVLIP